MIQDFSLNITFIILKVYQHVYNIHLLETVSQNLKIVPKKREDLKKKNYNYFSRFHKIKSRSYIKNLRNGSLQMNVFCRHVNFHDWGMIIKGDILVQKIKVKKSIFKFLDPSFHCRFTNVNINNIS